MKKAYETPSVEVVKVQYKDQVVAASGGVCSVTNVHDNGRTCVSGEPVYTH